YHSPVSHKTQISLSYSFRHFDIQQEIEINTTADPIIITSQTSGFELETLPLNSLSATWLSIGSNRLPDRVLAGC
ncbi:MAG: hypothetical protein AB2689_29030, partial [Candidatus Thiodiazotropha taylori]